MKLSLFRQIEFRFAAIVRLSLAGITLFALLAPGRVQADAQAVQLVYSTYFGGSSGDYANGVARDKAGNIYIAGSTNSTDLPVHQAAQATYGGGDADIFVVKLDPTGTQVLYATYLGGGGTDGARAIAVDDQGNAYITGKVSTPAPITPVDFIYVAHAFVAKLDPAGEVVYLQPFGSTIIGNAIAVDGEGRAYVTGEIASSDLPVTPNALQSERGETVEAFVTVFDPTGNTILYSTFLGNNGEYCSECGTSGRGIAVDREGMIYVTGSASPTFPTTQDAFQMIFHGHFFSAFLAKIDPSRSGTASLVYSTLLGGDNNDIGTGITLDTAGKVYITGMSKSPAFPTTPGAFDRTCGTDGRCNYGEIIDCGPTLPGDNPVCITDERPDVFVAKLDPNQPGKAGLIFSTYIGANGPEEGYGITVDPAGNVYVTGRTVGFFPMVDPLQRNPGGNYDAFVTKLSPDGSTLLYSTYLGGNSEEEGRSIVVDANGNAYVVGITNSAAFPTVTPLFSQAGGVEFYLAKLTDTPFTPIPEPDAGGSGKVRQLFLPLIQKSR